LLHSVNVESYFEKEQDERLVKDSFNLSLINDVLRNTNLFTEVEQAKLKVLQTKFKENIAGLSPTVYNKEMERLAIDLSWKSSQIEGNTYTLLETERLLLEKETAAGKPKDDAIMLLNHKEALNFIIAHTDYVVPLDWYSIALIDLYPSNPTGFEPESCSFQRHKTFQKVQFNSLKHKTRYRSGFYNIVEVRRQIVEPIKGIVYSY